jgi:hypothetical protein
MRDSFAPASVAINAKRAAFFGAQGLRHHRFRFASVKSLDRRRPNFCDLIDDGFRPLEARLQD